MFRKDKFIFGLLGGLILPGFAWAYENLMKDDLGVPFQNKSTYLISIGLNLILVRIAYKKDFDHTGSGLMFISFLAAIAMFYFKLRP